MQCAKIANSHGPVAQLGERSVRIREVEGSNPFRSTTSSEQASHRLFRLFYCFLKVRSALVSLFLLFPKSFAGANLSGSPLFWQVSYRLRRLFLFLSEKPPVRSLHCASSSQKALLAQTFPGALIFGKFRIACAGFFYSCLKSRRCARSTAPPLPKKLCLRKSFRGPQFFAVFQATVYICKKSTLKHVAAAAFSIKNCKKFFMEVKTVLHIACSDFFYF